MENLKGFSKEKEFIFDLKDTLFRNIFWIFMFSFCIIFSFMGLHYANKFTDENIKIMALIFYLFITLKLLGWVGHPEIVLKEKR